MINKILFAPVSAKKGSGEYQRCLLIANAISEQLNGNVEIKFIISEDATYVDDVPYSTEVLPSSVTFHPEQFKHIADQFSPDLVIFDDAGRVSSYRYAKKAGAKVALLGSRAKKWKRGVSLKVLLSVDIFIPILHIPDIFKLSFFEKFKLNCVNTELFPVNALFNKPSFSNTDFPLPEKYIFIFLTGGEFIFKDVNVKNLTLKIANEIKIATKITPVIIESDIPKAINIDGVIKLPSLKNDVFMSLIQGAEVCILGTGSVVAQALSIEKNTVLIPTSKTGKNCAKDYEALGVSSTVSLEPSVVGEKVSEVLQKETSAKIIENIKKIQFSNDLDRLSKKLISLIK